MSARFATRRWIAALAAASLLTATSAVYALSGAGLSGKVTGQDGAVVAGARVALLKPPARQQGDAKPDKQSAEPGDKGDKKGPKGEGPKGDRPRPEPVAETTTDAEGNFSFSGIAPGKYMLVAGLKGAGMARQPVELTEGEATSVNLQLKPREPGQGGGKDGEKPRKPKDN